MPATAALAAASGVIAGRRLLADEARRVHLERSLRIWRLTARRGVGYGVNRIRGFAADADRRAELDRAYAIRSAEDVARELGHMKGAMMKAGQVLSFVVEGLPDEARNALATLQADVAPMAPTLAAKVVEAELGAPPEHVFLDWSDEPVAAASIGQVHRAVTRDGREVAVKVQYPGIDVAIGGDLRNAELLYRMASSFAFDSLDARAVVDELRGRLLEELDYRIEAARQHEFAVRYAGHPFIRIPAVVAELSTRRVLTTEWADGARFADLVETGDPELRGRAAEVLFRFAQGSVYRARVFNGDPHPGNFRFHPDGSVTFLDFGMVKRWSDDDVARLWPIIDPLLAGDAEGTVACMADAGFIRRDHGFDAAAVWDYVVAPYVPYLTETFSFTPEFTKDSLRHLVDLRGPNAEIMAVVDMPPAFVILDRVVWGLCAMLGRLEATNAWRGILAEYREDGPPATPLGELEQQWWDEQGRRQLAEAEALAAREPVPDPAS